MRIKPEDMKSCFSCRFANAFIVPVVCCPEIEEIEVECKQRMHDETHVCFGDECSRWDRKG